MNQRAGRCAVDNSAAAAAAFAASSTTETVPCGAHPQAWARMEKGFALADREEQARRRATVYAICSTCPALAECAAWASEDKYTGFAAGNWYFSGSGRLRRITPHPDAEG